MAEDPKMQAILAVLDDEYAREILVATRRERLSAKELSERYEMSRPTVSRRVTTLLEQELLREHTRVDPGGHHAHEYEAALERVEILLTDEGFTVDVAIESDPADRLTSIVEGMRRD